jgi:nicotinate-nucleotide adenylyltransferase
MLRLATASNPYFRVSTIELERPGPSYSVDTVSQIRNELGSEDGLYFIVGYDELSELPLWKEPSRLLEFCQIAVVGRPGYKLDWHSVEGALPGISSRVVTLDVPQLEVSSTEIRGRVAAGLSIRYLVPEAVEGYIREHGLYKEGDCIG